MTKAEFIKMISNQADSYYETLVDMHDDDAINCLHPSLLSSLNLICSFADQMNAIYHDDCMAEYRLEQKRLANPYR
jgi:hypothetical protein